MSSALETIDIRPLEDLLFPRKEPRLCRTISTDRFATLKLPNPFERDHTRSFSGETMVNPSTPRTDDSSSFVEETFPSISSLDLAGTLSNLITGVPLYNSFLDLLEQRQGQRLNILKLLPFYDAILEDSEEERIENLVAQKWRMVRKFKVETAYRNALEAARVQKARRRRDTQNLKHKLQSQNCVLQQVISASQKVQNEMDRLKKQAKTASGGHIGISTTQNSAQIAQITVLKQRLEEKDVRLESAVTETRSLKRQVEDLTKENRAMTRNFIENQRAFHDHYARQCQIAACLDQDPAKTADVRRDLAYKDKMYVDLEKRAADCAGELKKVKLQSTLEQDRNENKICHLETELESRAIALRQMALRKERYRKSNEEILNMLKQRLTQDDFVNALSQYYDEVLQDNAFLSAAVQEQELELAHRRGQVYEMTAARRDLDSDLKEHEEKYSSLEKEKNAAENKKVELQVELELLAQQHARELNDRDAELANVHNTVAESQEFVARIFSMGTTESQQEMLKQKDNIIALQRGELIETKKLNLTLRNDLDRQTEITMDNARWISWGQHKEELRQKRLLNLTSEVERLRSLVLVKDGTVDMTEILDDIEAMRAVKAVRDDWIGDLARLAMKFLGYVHLLEQQLKSLDFELTVEGRAQLISECRAGLAYHGLTLNEDEQIEEGTYDDNWDAEELEKEDVDGASDDGLEEEFKEARNTSPPAKDAVFDTKAALTNGTPPSCSCRQYSFFQ